MKPKMQVAAILLGAVVFSLVLGGSQAYGQQQTPPAILSKATGWVDDAFTYQGVLLENGSPVTGTRSLTFKLYDTDSCSGTAVASVGPCPIYAHQRGCSLKGWILVCSSAGRVIGSRWFPAEIA